MSKKKRRLKKRIKRSQRKYQINPSAENRHHILWQAAHYSSGYARRLRLHPWLIILIPRDTLHREIHSRISDIPLPSEAVCKSLFFKLTELEKQDMLDYNAGIEERICWLLDNIDFDECPRTKLALIHQREVVHEFYNKAAKRSLEGR